MYPATNATQSRFTFTATSGCVITVETSLARPQNEDARPAAARNHVKQISCLRTPLRAKHSQRDLRRGAHHIAQARWADRCVNVASPRHLSTIEIAVEQEIYALLPSEHRVTPSAIFHGRLKILAQWSHDHGGPPRVRRIRSVSQRPRQTIATARIANKKALNRP